MNLDELRRLYHELMDRAADIERLRAQGAQVVLDDETREDLRDIEAMALSVLAELNVRPEEINDVPF